MKRIGLTAILQGVFTFMPQLIGLIVFSAGEFGDLATALLLYAWLVSILYSVVNETWARSRMPRDNGMQFSGALVRYCATVTAVAGVAFLALPSMRSLAGWAVAAIFSALMRDGSRYWRLATGQTSRVLITDASGLIVYASWLLVAGQGSPLTVSVVLQAWAAGALVAAIGLMPSWAGLLRGSLLRWVKDRRQVIRPLLGESLLMDAGALGGPALIGLATSTAQFGGYRAVQSLAGPLNVLFTALRPVMVQVSTVAARTRLANLSLLAGIVTAVTAPVAVLLVSGLSPSGSVLEGLSAVALPAGVMLGARIAAVPSYLVVRLHASGRVLIGSRLVDLGVGLALPLLGLLVHGFSGAVVGLAVGNVVSAVVWQWSVRHLAATPSLTPLPTAAREASC